MEELNGTEMFGKTLYVGRYMLIGNHSHASINSYMDKSVPLPQEMVCTLEVIVQGSEESRATTGASQEI